MSGMDKIMLNTQSELFGATTLSLRGLCDTQNKCHSAEKHYSECRILFIIMLNVVMLNVIVLSVVAPAISISFQKRGWGAQGRMS
jgi:hypothetical protein